MTALLWILNSDAVLPDWVTAAILVVCSISLAAAVGFFFSWFWLA